MAFSLARSGSPQVIDVDRPGGSVEAPTIVFVHSGTTTRNEWSGAPRASAQGDYVGITIEYRRYALWPQPLDDVEAAVQYVRADTLGIQPNRIAIGGDPVGGALAVDIALGREPGFVQAAFG